MQGHCGLRSTSQSVQIDYRLLNSAAPPATPPALRRPFESAVLIHADRLDSEILFQTYTQ